MDGLLVEPSFVLFVPVITDRDETSVVVHDPQQMRFYLFGPFVFIARIRHFVLPNSDQSCVTYLAASSRLCLMQTRLSPQMADSAMGECFGRSAT